MSTESAPSAPPSATDPASEDPEVPLSKPLIKIPKGKEKEFYFLAFFAFTILLLCVWTANKYPEAILQGTVAGIISTVIPMYGASLISNIFKPVVSGFRY